MGVAVRRCVQSIGWFEDISMLWCFTAKKKFTYISQTIYLLESLLIARFFEISNILFKRLC